jgi:hypothetical protein
MDPGAAMDDNPASDTGEFDDHVYTAGDLSQVLRNAAQGLVPSDDPAIAFDPVGWTVALVRALQGSSLWPALSAALAELMLSHDEKEARFAAAVGRLAGVMGSGILAHALAKQSQYDRTETVSDLAWATASLAISDPSYRYDPLLRAVLMRVPSSLGLIMVVSRFDAAWFVERAASICAQDVSEAARQLSYAEIGAGGAPQFTAELRAALAVRRPELVHLLDHT